MTLFELAEQLKAVREAYENDESITPEMLQAAELDVEQKIKNYCIVIKEIKAEQNAVKALKGKLYAREKSLVRNLDFMKDNLTNIQRELGLKKVQVEGHRSGFRKKPASVKVVDETAIHDDYKRVEISYHKQAVMDLYKLTGEVAEGFEIDDTGEYIHVS